MSNRIFLLAAACASVAACASSPATQAQLASLKDPRMACVQRELITKGYNVDNSFRRPGQLVATRPFTTGDAYRGAVSAQIDGTSNTLEVWTRVIRADGTTVPGSVPAPSPAMFSDALEVENRCDNVK